MKAAQHHEQCAVLVWQIVHCDLAHMPIATTRLTGGLLIRMIDRINVLLIETIQGLDLCTR